MRFLSSPVSISIPIRDSLNNLPVSRDGLTKSSPVATQDGLMYTISSPVATQDGLVYTKSNTVATQNGLVYTKSSSVATQDGLVYTKSSPVASQDGLVYTKCSPIATQDGLVYTKSSPVASQDGLVYTKSSPVATQDGLVYTKSSLVASQDEKSRLSAPQSVDISNSCSTNNPESKGHVDQTEPLSGTTWSQDSSSPGPEINHTNYEPSDYETLRHMFHSQSVMTNKAKPSEPMTEKMLEHIYNSSRKKDDLIGEDDSAINSDENDWESEDEEESYYSDDSFVTLQSFNTDTDTDTDTTLQYSDATSDSALGSESFCINPFFS